LRNGAIFDPDDFSDLLNATNSARGFWDNPMDNEDWNVPLEENYE
jgi:hypothetical protein